MRSVNKVILVGNVTRDPELRQTSSGQPIATFGIATNRDWITKDGQKHSLAEYHEVVAWSRLAELCGKFVKKSKLVYIEGYLKTRSWDMPDGTKRFKTEIVITDLIMLDKRPRDGEMEDAIPMDSGVVGDESGMDMPPPDSEEPPATF